MEITFTEPIDKPSKNVQLALEEAYNVFSQSGFIENGSISKKYQLYFACLKNGSLYQKMRNTLVLARVRPQPRSKSASELEVTLLFNFDNATVVSRIRYWLWERKICRVIVKKVIRDFRKRVEKWT
ncbi:hypothetical protein [Flagellimonas meridianipacifica]|uniref:Uncharacterized protein n=1 Tax=Flagellimonas meridianipacifica TaxID=1080225 RepID=A0A2T0M932_9FLAO|nr:hypothetical protein [Allomuricauda pacifica]PRX53990.1 hypothetical protein CLV81_2384 [Allomuricauda pacifica]